MKPLCVCLFLAVALSYASGCGWVVENSEIFETWRRSCLSVVQQFFKQATEKNKQKKQTNKQKKKTNKQKNP